MDQVRAPRREGLLTTRQAADLLRVAQSSVTNWVNSGTLPANRTPGGHRRISPADLARFIVASGMPLPAELEEHRLFRIVWVDGDSTRREHIQRAAEGKSASEVTIAATVAEGLIRSGADDADVLVLDENAQDVPREAALREVKRFKPSVRVVYVDEKVPPADGATPARDGVEFTALRWADVATILDNICNPKPL